MLALIDGDIFRYRCAFAAERNYYLVQLTNANSHKEYKEFDYKKEAQEYGRRVISGVSASFRIWQRKEVQPVENCLQIVKTSLQQTIDDVKACFREEVESKIYISGKSNFRDKIATTKPYKGNRETLVKPIYYREVGDYITEKWGANITEGIEADDAIGIAAMEAKERGVSYVVVSNDKDLDQIPGHHYNWTTKEFYEVSAREAKTSFFIQLLAGDATDNIPGLPGIGKATAAKIIQDCKTPEEMVDKVWVTYMDRLGTKGPLTERQDKDYFLEQANLVFIRKHKDKTWLDTKEGFYWEDRYAVH